MKFRKVYLLFSILLLYSVIMAVSLPETEKIHTETEPLGEKQVIALYAYHVLDSKFGLNSTYERGIADRDFDMMFLTIMHNNSIKCCMSGTGSNFSLYTEETVENCINDERFGGILKKEETGNAELVFNFLSNRTRINGTLKNLEKEIELGIHGIEVEKEGKRAFFKESVPITKNYDLEKTMERLCQKAGLDSACYEDPQTEIYRYDTETFKSDRESVEDLYRYNVLMETDDIDNEMLYERVSMARSWFLKNINNGTGILEYVYYPSLDEYSPDNNHVRQLATLWAMSKASNFLNDTALNRVAENTLDFYLGYRVCREDYCYLEIENRSKLAYSAFLILALINNPDYPESKELQESFARGILSLQNGDGSFRTYFLSNSTSGTDYYPGEAMLSLMTLYRNTGKTAYLDSVIKAFPYYRDYWRGNKNTAFVPWHSQTYLLLYNETENPEVADFVFEMNDWLILNYQIRESEYADEIGGFPKGKPRNSASSYLEGINDAYVLAKILGDGYHSQKYGDSVREGTRFILLTQYTKDNAFYISNQERAIGGFRHSLERNDQRNDYTQHAVMALMKAYKNGIFNAR